LQILPRWPLPCARCHASHSGHCRRLHQRDGQPMSDPSNSPRPKPPTDAWFNYCLLFTPLAILRPRVGCRSAYGPRCARLLLEFDYSYVDPTDPLRRARIRLRPSHLLPELRPSGHRTGIRCPSPAPADVAPKLTQPSDDHNRMQRDSGFCIMPHSRRIADVRLGTIRTSPAPSGALAEIMARPARRQQAGVSPSFWPVRPTKCVCGQTGGRPPDRREKLNSDFFTAEEAVVCRLNGKARRHAKEWGVVRPRTKGRGRPSHARSAAQGHEISRGSIRLVLALLCCCSDVSALGCISSTLTDSSPFVDSRTGDAPGLTQRAQPAVRWQNNDDCANFLAEDDMWSRPQSGLIALVVLESPRVRMPVPPLRRIFNAALIADAPPQHASQYMRRLATFDSRTASGLNDYCINHLVSRLGRLQQNILGLAYLGRITPTTFGGVCSPPSHMIGRNIGMATYANKDGQPILSRQALLCHAHTSLATTWRSEHDQALHGPSWLDGGPYLMYQIAVSGSVRHHSMFSECSSKQIAIADKRELMESQDSLLSLLVPAKAAASTRPATSCGGNHRREPGEECDPGLAEDRCCSADCRLKPPARCSDANSPCCRGCQFAGPGYPVPAEVAAESLRNLLCTGLNDTCPRPANEKDGAPCNFGVGYCLLGRWVFVKLLLQLTLQLGLRQRSKDQNGAASPCVPSWRPAGFKGVRLRLRGATPAAVCCRDEAGGNCTVYRQGDSRTDAAQPALARRAPTTCRAAAMERHLSGALPVAAGSS
uniref:Disintegrin domain-containing protein n=1 Tax=Macrostomum lignano TaxID=282301 RepID=A0A1I8JNY8_9PLAT